MVSNVHTAYGWSDARHTGAHGYTLPAVIRLIQQQAAETEQNLRVLDLGCGNGSAAGKLAELGYNVMAVDVSADGVEIARRAYPQVRFEVGSVYDEGLCNTIGDSEFDTVVSLDVVEHLFYPKKLFERSHSLLKSGGLLIVSTPYHGYLKNLALSFANAWDTHFGVDQDGGHIKFFSKQTIAQMAGAAGFERPEFTCVGRLPLLWKAMILVVRKGDR